MSSTKKSSISSKTKILLLTGPTGAGKTPLLLETLSGISEVVSADSVQVYRGLDIGSAKPTYHERELLPHHMLDILSPSEHMSLSIFLENAEKAVAEISGRGFIPVVSGGTLYYLRHWLYGLPETPLADAAIREYVSKREGTEGYEALWTELGVVDPKTRERLHFNDKYRVKRALEVWYQTGRPLSAYSRSSETYRQDTVVIALRREKPDLVKRLAQRLDAMLKTGWPEEVSSLLAKGYNLESPGLQTLGYFDIAEALFQGQNPYERRDAILQKTIHLAKRQMTFLRSLPNVVWVQPTVDSLRRELRNHGFLQE